MEWICPKCGNTHFENRNIIFPEKGKRMKIELSVYYVKSCLNCGYSEFYKAKIVDKNEEKEPVIAPEY